MFILEYAVCDSKDGLENWLDHKAYCQTLENVNTLKKGLRDEYKGALLIFEDVYQSEELIQ
jgi:hypothetical protein